MEAMNTLNARNVPAVRKIQTTVGTSAGLPSLDIAFYKGATPHKMGGISTECGVPTGGMLEVNLLLLDGCSSGRCRFMERPGWELVLPMPGSMAGR